MKQKENILDTFRHIQCFFFFPFHDNIVKLFKSQIDTILTFLYSRKEFKSVIMNRIVQVLSLLAERASGFWL